MNSFIIEGPNGEPFDLTPYLTGGLNEGVGITPDQLEELGDIDVPGAPGALFVCHLDREQTRKLLGNLRRAGEHAVGINREN